MKFIFYGHHRRLFNYDDDLGFVFLSAFDCLLDEEITANFAKPDA